MDFARDTWVGKKRTKGLARKGVGKKRTKGLARKGELQQFPKLPGKGTGNFFGTGNFLGTVGKRLSGNDSQTTTTRLRKPTTPLRANDSDNDSARAKLRTKRRQDLDFTTKLSTTHRQYLSIAPRSYAPRTAYSRLIINQLARSDTNAT